MPSKTRALKRYNGSPLGLNQRAESGLPWCCLLQCNAVERQGEDYFLYQPLEPTHASAVGVPMTHCSRKKKKKSQAAYYLCVCQRPHLDRCFESADFSEPAEHPTTIARIKKTRSPWVE